MPKFYNRDVADLTRQLTLSPRRLRMQQIRGIAGLLAVAERDRAYPFEFVCYRITNYRKRGPTTGPSIPGDALIADLTTMAEVLSRKANLTAAELEEPFKTHLEVARELHVSTKTIRRWRSRGLLGLRVVFADGVNRLAFPQSALDAFVSKHKDLVQKGASFSQLSETERELIARRAKELVAERPLRLHAAARIIAAESGRAVETVRYTLRRYDEAHPAAALFAGRGRGMGCERHAAMWRCHKAGETTSTIARAFECSAAEVGQVLRQVQVSEWAQMPWEHVHDELFEAPDADEVILRSPEPAGAQIPPARPPSDLPPYLRSLYLTPLLSPEQERDLFRRYNYVKYKIAKILKAADPEEIGEVEYAALAAMIAAADALRQRIIRANLRLVVSIARKHMGPTPGFFEVVSDGNMSLMRAVEKFDYLRGTKFSTYATWAIVKNYARSIPEQLGRYSRYVTGQDEVLEAASDNRSQPASDSDRQRVRELITAGMSELDEREREIVSSHFGLGNKNGSLTLEQLGQRFGVTKERVRQIEQRALCRLRELLAPSLADTIAG